MKRLIASCALFGLLTVGCVSTVDKERIRFQAARLDRAVALIDSGTVTKEEMEKFIRGERRIWHALNYSINGDPLPPDLQPGE